MQGKYVLIGETDHLESIIQFMNEKHSIPFRLSEQKVFLSFRAIAMRKSLPKIIIDQINKMQVNKPNITLLILFDLILG